MFDHVQFTGTINLGSVVSTVLLLLSAITIYVREKTHNEKTRRIVREENEKTRDCVHKIPGHPENSNGVDGVPPTATQQNKIL